MAKEDFLGTWDVQLTSGTPFGIGSSVQITVSPQGGDHLRIRFESAVNHDIEAMYHPATEELQVISGLQSPAKAMYISRYVGGDPEYRAIYGLTICEGRSPDMPWLTVWGADMPPAVSRPKPAAASMEVPDRRLDPASFDDSYRVGSTSGSQFGIGSTIVFSENGTRVTITDTHGGSVPVPESLTFELSTDSVHGATPMNDVTHLWSLATYNSKKYVYGLSLEAPASARRGDGWPEQAGACGAEEEPDPEEEPDT